MAMEHEAYSVGWLSLALINTGLAQSKGRWGLPWFFLSLVLGPIITFLLVSIRDRNEMSALEKDQLFKEMKRHLDESERLEGKAGMSIIQQ
jgi:hypothetical protein